MKLKPICFRVRNDHSSASTLLTWLHDGDRHKFTFSYILLIASTKFHFWAAQVPCGVQVTIALSLTK